MEVHIRGKDSDIEIITYAPTSGAEDETVEQFHDDIERTVADCDSKYKIITGDFNPKIETKTKEDFISMGAWNRRQKGKRRSLN